MKMFFYFVKNNGKIQICENKIFSVPLGAIMELKSGVIKQ